MSLRARTSLYYVGFSLFFMLPARGQWHTQTISLRPGWNAVFLEVAPEPSRCATVLDGLPIDSVWTPNAQESTVRYVPDGEDLPAAGADWLVYRPSGAGSGDVVTSLHTLQGGRGYLFKVNGNEYIDLELTGRPVNDEPEWTADSFNLVGFPTSTTSPPTVAAYFASSPAHAGQDVLRMDTAGRWQKITSPATTTLQRGEAYWVYCSAPSTFAAPLTPVFEQGDGLDFGRELVEINLRLRNATSRARQVTLTPGPSEQPPGTEFPALAGNVPLSYYKIDGGIIGWQAIESPLSLTAAAATDTLVRLAVRRSDMADFPTAPGDTVSALYQSILSLTDTDGLFYRIPVSSEGIQRTADREGSRTPSPWAGLWVGTAVINAVSEPSRNTEPEVPRPVPDSGQFEFRLIVHVDDDGNANLLQQVVVMFQAATYQDPPDNTIIDVPAHFVLLTDESLVSDYSGAAMRDGQLVARRISTAAFGFDTPQALTGSGFNDLTPEAVPLTCSVAMDYNDALNPFKHKYHPAHDNKDARFEDQLSEGDESFTFTRQPALTFTSDDPEGLDLPDWGDQTVGGTYRETLSGIHHTPINISGFFRLHRSSDVGELNDGK